MALYICIMVMNKELFCVLLIILMLNACKDSAQDLKSSKPNIVIILADDFGVGDIQAHYPNNKIHTPHLDNLVHQGMSFTDAHSGSAVCTPTRYGLLTGRYAWRTPLQEWVIACYEPPLIEASRLTLPMHLKQHGYQTACIGKWHLGLNWSGERTNRRVEAKNSLKDEEWNFEDPILEGPTKRGFDYYFGTHVPNFPPFTFIENDHVVEQPTARYKYDPKEGVVMPKEFPGAPMAPGWRFDRILPILTRKAVDYIHEQSRLDAPFFLYFSMTSPHEPVVPSKDFKGKSGIAPIADFVMETDWSAGQIIKALEDAGISDNTMVIFTADNGHSHYTGWESLIDAGHLPSGPYRGHKGDIWEGGHRVPFIVRWPGKVASGTMSNQLVCLTDIFTTCAEVVGGDPLPNNTAEDGFSFLSTLIESDDTASRANLISHSVNGEFAYRNGNWKIVFKLPGNNLASSRGEPAAVELYNLNEDIGEEFNMAGENHELVRQLTGELKSVVQRGTSRTGPPQFNDVKVRFDTIQTERWAPTVHQVSLKDAEVIAASTPAPLFRDPVYDGAADPVLVWNPDKRFWWMFYTQRRAKIDVPGVEWCHGTEIGVAESRDSGFSWTYIGTLPLSHPDNAYSFWAPDVILDDQGIFHLFPSYVPGAPETHRNWGGERHIFHYTSKDLWNWKFQERVPLSSDYCIDATLFRKPDGKWRMWYKDEGYGSKTLAVDSRDLRTWSSVEDPGVSKLYGEGPKTFWFKGHYWLIKDPNSGLDVYRSSDLESWDYQGKILDTPGTRNSDGTIGKHADIVVCGNRAYIIYFTHPYSENAPERNGVLPLSNRHTALQAAEIEVIEGRLECDRDKPFRMVLHPPQEKHSVPAR